MSFDARSLERLRQLGRTLPQRLPAPEPPATPAATPGADGLKGDGRRHRLETETDPEALFHELVRASSDGSAPPHLLERLRDLEARRARPESQQQASAGEQPGFRGHQAAGSAPGKDRRRERGRPDPQLVRDHADLYTAFQQLLLEDDEI
ncbi:MAG: hypothetical protein AB1Z21_05100 [Synechococcaceae cyanobacterium]